MKIVGTNRDDIDRTPLDFYSIGHIILGSVSYIVCLMVSCILVLPSPFEWAMILTICVGVIWELIENTVLLNTRIKFENRMDSLYNSLLDIVFVSIGGFIEMTIVYFNNFWGMFLYTFVVNTLMYLIFDICSRLTLSNEKNK